jgi:Ca2+:H+ antiporter
MAVMGKQQQAPQAESGSPLTRSQQITISIAILITVLSGILHQTSLTVLTFISTAAALAVLATLVGTGTEQIGSRLGPGATGVLQSALGNLPEMFFGIFALRQGPDYVPVVQAALIGSVLGNSLLVLGLAFAVGGLRHGTQRFHAETPRNIALLTVLAVAAIMIPTLAAQLHTKASLHEDELSIVCAVVLLIVFFCGIPFSLQGGPTRIAREEEEERHWPMGLAIAVLLGASVAAAFVADWFVAALAPATAALHITPAFAGLVIVALAGNAVENVVGVQLMARNKPDYAISVILNSSLQVALALIPALVLLSFVIGGAHLTLVLPPLLLGGLFLSTLLGALVVYDGESTWLEGFALIGLYAIIAASFWWG